MKTGHAILGTALAIAGGWIAIGPGIRWLMMHEVDEALQVATRVHGTASHSGSGVFELRDIEVSRNTPNASVMRIDRVVAQLSPKDFWRRRSM